MNIACSVVSVPSILIISCHNIAVTCIQKVLGLNLGAETGYTEVVLFIIQLLQVNVGIVL
jgi:hypothetical protein